MLHVVDGVSGPRAAFLQHSNYLRAFHTIIHTRYGQGWPWPSSQHELLAGLASAARASGCLKRFRPASSVDNDLLRRTLRNAWGSELLLATPVGDELVGIANNWHVVQAYYACYQSAQALAAARGISSPTTHERLQNQFSATWIVKSVDLPPWSFGFKLGSVENAPPGITFRKLRHGWEDCSPESCWSLALKALETTRGNHLTRRKQQARKDKQKERSKAWEKEREGKESEGRTFRKKKPTGMPNLTAEEREDIDRKMRATSMVDYLYRLRMRSNYDDPTMFTDGPEHPTESQDVHTHLSDLTASTLLIHELQIREVLGRARVESLIDEWLKDVGVATLGLRLRRDIFCAA